MDARKLDEIQRRYKSYKDPQVSEDVMRLLNEIERVENQRNTLIYEINTRSWNEGLLNIAERMSR